MALLDVLVDVGEIALEGAWHVICAGLDRLGVGAGLRPDSAGSPGTVLGLRADGTQADRKQEDRGILESRM